MANKSRKPAKRDHLPEQIQTFYQKSQQHRVVHADGAWGGITPQLNIHMALYSEHSPVPDKVTYQIGEDHRLGRIISKEGHQGLVREVEVEVILSIPTAKALRDWLNERIGMAEQMMAEATRVSDGEAKHDSPNI